MKTLFLLAALSVIVCPAEPGEGEMKHMVLVQGGTFRMGDLFGENARGATPVHEVTLSTFYLNRFEVTVEEFSLFVKESGYVTSAEKGKKAAPPEVTSEETYKARLATRGALLLGPPFQEKWATDASWKNPHYKQSPKDPVACISWNDAVSYCNWLNKKKGLPKAYDLKSGDLLDAEGKPTTDVTKVKGYRLPTEAEWEYAAREEGKKIRFGNGKNTAQSSEMNINVKGEFRKKTVPVGSFEPNSLGLHDMSGNVWEWCSDYLCTYSEKAQTNPYRIKPLIHGPRRAARGGPWVGDASYARVFARLGWIAEDRCNNIGFRLARSK